MKKKLLLLACISALVSVGLKAQTVQLYRQASDPTDAATEWTYTTSAGGDKVTYPASSATSSSGVCAPAVRRVQVAAFGLNYKSSSIGKIVISANSSGGTSTRTLTKLIVNGTDVTSAVTIASTVNGNSGGGAGYSDCGDITITGLNVAKDATNGINLDFTFDNNIRLNTISVWSIEALPLDFLSFTAKPDAFGKTVALNWSTTNEVNTKNFEIQRRTDGTDFVTINTLPSKNTTGVHNYAFTDNNAVSGNSYYRIIQFDNDGASTISKIQGVTNKVATALSIYPNPTTGTLNVSHDAAGAGAIARVVNMDGKTVFQQALSLSATDTKMDVSQLTAGSYLLILDNQNQKSSLKFIKQ